MSDFPEKLKMGPNGLKAFAHTAASRMNGAAEVLMSVLGDIAREIPSAEKDGMLECWYDTIDLVVASLLNEQTELLDAINATRDDTGPASDPDGKPTAQPARWHGGRGGLKGSRH